MSELGKLEIKEEVDSHFGIYPEGGEECIAIIWDNEDTAKYFIRRWNAFEEGGLVDELKKACKALMKAWITPEPRSMHQLKEDMDNAYQKAEAALAKN